MKTVRQRANHVVPIRTVLPLLPVVNILLPLAQQARTPQEQLRVLHVVPTHTVLPVLPVVNILLPLVQLARMPRAQPLVLLLAHWQVRMLAMKPLLVLHVVPIRTVLLVLPVVIILLPLVQ